MNKINSGLWDNQPCAVQNVRFQQESSDAEASKQKGEDYSPGLIKVVATKDIAAGEEFIALYNADEKDLSNKE